MQLNIPRQEILDQFRTAEAIRVGESTEAMPMDWLLEAFSEDTAHRIRSMQRAAALVARKQSGG